MLTEADPRMITRVALRNYRSIAVCDITLAPLTILVGPNGAGKSNFLDALQFTAQALRFSLDHALRERGGISEVRRRSRGNPNHFGVRLEFKLSSATGWYAFEVGAGPKGRYVVRKEECVVRAAGEAGSSRSGPRRLHGRFARRSRSHGGTDLRARSND